MWILPKQLHTSDFVPDTEALSLDSTELSEICARSLFVRSKPSPARTWSQKWKRDSWTQHLSGRILNPSHGQSFVTAWTSSLAVIPASPSAQPESASAQKTLGTSGLSSQTEFDFFAPDSAISRMSKDTSASASEKSLESWNKLVIQRRGEYSARLKSGRLTSASGSSSWPTIRASEYKDTGPIGSKSHDHMLGKGYLCAVVTQDAANWPTPAVMDTTGGSYKTEWIDGRAVSYHNHKEENPVAYGAKLSDAVKYGQAAPANPSTDGSRQGLSWMTPRACEAQNPPMGVDKRHHGLTHQVTKQWLTPKVPSGGGQATRTTDGGGLRELEDQTEAKATGKLNPRWVETLMGLPVGWVMPSCASPVTIEQTNCDSSATESSLPQPSELFAF